MKVKTDSECCLIKYDTYFKSAERTRPRKPKPENKSDAIRTKIILDRSMVS